MLYCIRIDDNDWTNNLYKIIFISHSKLHSFNKLDNLFFEGIISQECMTRAYTFNSTIRNKSAWLFILYLIQNYIILHDIISIAEVLIQKLLMS